MYEHQIVNIDDLIPYALNSRTHSEQQVAQIAASIREFGFTNPVLIDDQNNLIAGHGRVLAARKLKMSEVPAIIVTGLDERKRRALIIADNKLALNAGWDDNALKVELEDLTAEFGHLMGFDENELNIIFNGSEDALSEELSKNYSRKIQAPIYQITGECPKVSELYDTTKTGDLSARIMEADLSDDVRGFLMAAATRHTIFNFRNIAEFYAHADPEVQKLMEQSALVIIDYDKAIENGFVELTKAMLQQAGKFHRDEDESSENDNA